MLTNSRQYHKVLCKSFADFAQRPSQDVRRAIFFPELGDKSHFIWLPVEAKSESYGQSKELLTINAAPYSADLGVPEKDVHAASCLPSEDGPLGKFDVDTSAMLLVCGKLRCGELLDHSIVMLARRDLMKRGPNKSLERLIKQPVNRAMFRGPLIFIGMNKVKLPKYTVDLDTTALTLGMDAIVSLAPAGTVPYHAEKVQAVKVNYTPTPFLEQLEVPKRHPVFKSGKKCEVADLHITPLQLWFYPADSEKTDSTDSSTSAPDAPPFDTKVLHLCVDPTSPDFGHVPASMQADKRSILVAQPPNNLELGLDVDYLCKLGKNYEEKFVPWLSERQGGTPADRLRRMKEVTATIFGWAKESEDVRKKMKSLGLSDKEAEAAAKASVDDAAARLGVVLLP